MEDEIRKCKNKSCKQKNLKDSDFYITSDKLSKRGECKYCTKEKALIRFHVKQKEREMYSIV